LAALFDFYRLPECVAGHPRDEDHPFPPFIRQPTRPRRGLQQTVYTLLQAMLGLQPFAPLRFLFVDPMLPAWLPEITITGMRVADAVIALRFFRRTDGTSDYEIVAQTGDLHVMRQPSPWSLTASLAERAGDALDSLLH